MVLVKKEICVHTEPSSVVSLRDINLRNNSPADDMDVVLLSVSVNILMASFKQSLISAIVSTIKRNII